MSAFCCNDLRLSGPFSLDSIPFLVSLPEVTACWSPLRELQDTQPAQFNVPGRAFTVSGEHLTRTQVLYVSVVLFVSVLLSWF